MPNSEPLAAGRSVLKFLLPACAGIVIFLGPVISEESQTVVFGLITAALKNWLGAAIDEVFVIAVSIAALGALAMPVQRWFRPEAVATAEPSLLNQLFSTSWPWIILRLVGASVALCVYFEIGPQVLRLPDTGITVIKDIGHNVLMIYLVGLLLMPLLTEYGLMEFAGTLCGPVFRRLFRLPGRAAIDSLTSIVAASAIGTLVTISQYQRGFYTARESCVIACNFSLVSIPFSLLIAQVARIQHLFFGWYLSVLVAAVLCAMVLSRIAPLAQLPHRLINNQAPPEPSRDSGMKTAWRAALDRAAQGPGLVEYLQSAMRNFAITTAGVLAPSLAIATLTAILLFHTPVISVLTWPIAQLLGLFGATDSELIANGILIGFLDQFLPTLVAASLNSEFWRFVLAGLSVTQLIFMSEFGLLMLRSPLPVTLPMLARLFVMRTVLTLPVLLLCAALLTKT